MSSEKKKYTQEVFLFNKVQLDWPKLVVADSYQDNAKKEYSTTLLVDKNGDDAKKMQLLIPKMLTDHFGKDTAPKVMALITDDRKLRCYDDGDKKRDKDLNPIAHYQNKLTITVKAKEEQPHKFFAVDGKPIDYQDTAAWQAEGRKFYAGCFANVAVQFWVQDSKWGRAFRSTLIGIQFAGDGDKFAGGTPGVVPIPNVNNMFGAATVEPTVAPLPAAPFGSTPAFVE